LATEQGSSDRRGIRPVREYAVANHFERGAMPRPAPQCFT
jgi:hypothetical protein